MSGEKLRQSLDLTNWEAAQKRVRDWEVHGIRSVVTLKEAYERFVEQHVANDSAPATLVKHRRLQNLTLEFFGNVPLRSLSVDDVSRFRGSWKFAPLTTKNTIERLRSFFKFCIDREWIEKNPASKLRLPKIGESDSKPYEPEEMKRIWEAVDQFPSWGIYGEKTRERLRAFLTVLRWTGMRIGDCVQIEDSKIADGQITIRTTKNGKRVSIPLHPEAQAALKKIKNGSRYYFWSGEGTLKSAISAWERTMKRLYKICGFRAHCHRFRHTFATQLLSKGVPISEVAAILGNSARIVERHYPQWISARQTALEAAVKGTW